MLKISKTVRTTENKWKGGKRGGGSGVTEVSISSSQGQISLEVTMETETHSVDTCWVSLRGARFPRPGVGSECLCGCQTYLHPTQFTDTY